MDAIRLGVVIWSATLGYFLLWHGVQNLSHVGQSSSKPASSSGSGGAKMAANELGFLGLQSILG